MKPSTLLIPAAGQSSRYPGLRPKWLLTLPDGRLMVESCAAGMALDRFERVVVACLRDHVDRYLSADGLAQIRQAYGRPDLEFQILDTPTRSQAETVAAAIRQAHIGGAVFVKDCDNVFEHAYGGGNEIASVDLNDVDFIDARSKSYVTVDPLGYAVNIVEKQVIGNRFCCGGYGFEDAQSFVQHFDRITQPGEVYVSHVIYSMILAGEKFKVAKVKGYTDWGTLREFRRFAAQHLVVFCDVDGVLLKNGGRFAPAGWRTPGLEGNLRSLAKLQAQANIHLIITSSRPDSEVPYVEAVLKDFGVRVDRWIMGLPHARRVLVNDFSPSNPFPSAVALNLERDAETLEQMLRSQVDLAA
jgi:hypothetical protein